ncbi:hypothetical protein U1Q18_033994 [Sarracenia purpurea var. burkii]
MLAWGWVGLGLVLWFSVCVLGNPWCLLVVLCARFPGWGLCWVVLAIDQCLCLGGAGLGGLAWAMSGQVGLLVVGVAWVVWLGGGVVCCSGFL